MRYVGDGASPWERSSSRTFRTPRRLRRICDYGEYGTKYLFRYWYAHDVEAFDLRTGASRGKERFNAVRTQFTCPATARFSIYESSKREKDVARDFFAERADTRVDRRAVDVDANLVTRAGVDANLVTRAGVDVDGPVVRLRGGCPAGSSNRPSFVDRGLGA